MKDNIHPEYNEIIFEDISNGERFVIASSAKTRDTIEVDGKKYGHYKVEVSSVSHPFYTGKKQNMDITGRVDKFNQRYAKLKRTETND